MGAHLVVLDLLQIPYEKVSLLILMVKNTKSVKGKREEEEETKNQCEFFFFN